MELNPPRVAPSPSVPGARRTILASFRTAALELWGAEGLAQIAARMPADARRETIDAVVLSAEFLPEEYVLAWYEAAFDGPAAGQNTEYFRFLDKMLDHGFGRVRRFLLGIAMSPVDVFPKCAELWRHDHTHGTLSFELTGRTSVTFTLRDHPYLGTPLARASIAEILRYVVALCRARGVMSTHSLEGNALLVRITWR